MCVALTLSTSGLASSPMSRRVLRTPPPKLVTQYLHKDYVPERLGPALTRPK